MPDDLTIYTVNLPQRCMYARRARFAVQNPVVPKGVAAYETDTRLYRMGDGVTAWEDLPDPLDAQENLTGYQSALADGFEGTEDEYLDSLGGSFTFPDLATTDPETAGIWWNDNGVIKVSADAPVVVPLTDSRYAVFPDDNTHYGSMSWAPQGADFTVKVKAEFTGTDDSVLCGGDIYANFGLIRKATGELQVWYDGSAITSDGMALAAGEGFVEIEVRRIGGQVSFWKNGTQAGVDIANSTAISSTPFPFRVGVMLSGSTKPMQGGISQFELVDDSDATNHVLFSFEADDWTNDSTTGTTVAAATNNGPVTFAAMS